VRYSYGKPLLFDIMFVQLGMGWSGYWVHTFTWQLVSVSLGQLFEGRGWAGSMKMKVGDNPPGDNPPEITPRRKPSESIF